MRLDHVEPFFFGSLCVTLDQDEQGSNNDSQREP